MEINEKRLFKTFKDIASLSSPSWKEDKVIKYLVDWAKENKVTVKKIKAGDSYNVLMRIKGKDRDRKPVLFSAHTDTVVPCDKIKVIETDTKFTSDGTSILGGDDKAGIAACLEAAKTLKENDVKHGNIEFLFTCAEEVGLCGMKLMNYEVLESKRAFVLDSGGPIGMACIKAPFHSIMEVTVQGKAAHAGMEPEKGVSSIYAASEIISALPKGRIDEETTTNVGTIKGGQADNIVAPETIFTLECRSLDKKKLKDLERTIKETIKEGSKKLGAKALVKYDLEYAGFTIKENSPLIKLFEKSCEAAKLKPQYEASGGGSDTNILNANKIPALNISVGMEKVHTTSEYLKKSDLIKASKLIASIIENA